VFPLVLDILKLYEDIQLTQIKEKLLLTKKMDSTNINDVIDFIWKIKKSIEVSF
jgi:hypothetical protein